MFKKITILLLLIHSLSFGQRIKIDKKRLEFLKEEREIGVKLTFPEDFVIHRGVTEKQFIERMKDKYTRINGNGETWYSDYSKAKKESWRNAFIQGINKKIEAYSDLQFVSTDKETDYTLIIEADWIYMGYGGQSSAGREEAKLEATLKFVKNSEPDLYLYVTQTPKIIGNYVSGEFGELLRVQECYDKLGFLLSLQLKRLF